MWAKGSWPTRERILLPAPLEFLRAWHVTRTERLDAFEKSDIQPIVFLQLIKWGRERKLLNFRNELE